MLSVRREGDERKSGGLGLSYRGARRMEENELEEGEAVSSLEYDSVVDPDVSLSYIDEKIQEVLGHFQKVFEGEISAESSGAKLGEYGSFLPVYLRLPPVWPQQTQNRVPARPSSQILPPENRTASASLQVPPGIIPASEAQVDDTKRINEENPGTNKNINKENGNNLLKVRIKVGSGNVLLRPLADIYSDMGLDYSPSSSPEGSPCTSGGISLGESPIDSPRAVFQVMTRFPIPEGCLLSPLPERCLHLTESKALGFSKGKLSIRKKSKSVKANLRSNLEMGIQPGKLVKSNPRKEKSSGSDHMGEEILEVVSSSDVRKSTDAGVAAADLRGKKFEEEKPNKQKVRQRGPHGKDPGISSNKSLNEEAEKITDPTVAEKFLLSRDSTLHEERETNAWEPGTKFLKKSAETLTSPENKNKPHLKKDHTSKKQNAVRSLEELSKNPAREWKTGNKVKASEKFPSESSEKSSDCLSRKNGEFSAASNVPKQEKESFPLMANTNANNASSLDTTVAPLGHVVIEDNWVCCDKCQQWRLLPYGMDPAQLPKKWLCSMLYWLPGMNKCSISEEETTRALHAAYQAPLAESQISLNDYPSHQAASGGLVVNGQNFDHVQNQAEFHNSLKKNSSGKEFLFHGGQATMESATLRESQANGLNKHYLEPRDKTAGTSFEKVKEKKKKEKTAEEFPGEGGVVERKVHHKSKSKRESGRDGSRVSKKLKLEEEQHADEDWNSIDEKSTSKRNMCLISKSLNFPSPKVGNMASYDSEGSKKKIKASEKISSNGDSIENSTKKRKEMEEMRSGPYREKSVKILKPEDEVTERDRGMKRPHKMMDITKKSFIDVEQKNHSHGFVESDNHMNSLESKRAHSDVHPCTEANSSSSKVSSSSKKITHFHEVGGSPVESVSSSPLKISNARGYDAFDGKKRGPHEHPYSGKPFSPAQNGPLKDYQNVVNNFKIKSKDKKPLQLSYGKEKDEQKESTKVLSNAQLRAKEKHKSSHSVVDKYKHKISNSVNSRHDSEPESRGESYRTSDKKDALGSSDSKPTKLQVQEGLAPSEKDPHSKTKKNSQFENSSKSSHEDKRPSNVTENSVENDVVLFEEKGKMPEQPRNLAAQHGRHQNNSAANVLKDARDLKHTANRLKAEGKEQQSTALYFEAALKFLHVAFLLELSSAESAQSMSMYSDTAKLCEFCAHEYEKLRDMAAAALAYKCMEVAYMKVVFSKHSNSSKDRLELQTALHLASSGDSPSSSASDIDNLNHQSTITKTSAMKTNPQMIGSLVIAPRNRPTYIRLLDFTQDINFAMEASRRSQNAFSGASQEESKYSPEGLASVKRALDLSFHDVEGLLRLIRQSMDSISH